MSTGESTLSDALASEPQEFGSSLRSGTLLSRKRSFVATPTNVEEAIRLGDQALSSTEIHPYSEPVVLSSDAIAQALRSHKHYDFLENFAGNFNAMPVTELLVYHSEPEKALADVMRLVTHNTAVFMAQDEVRQELTGYLALAREFQTDNEFSAKIATLLQRSTSNRKRKTSQRRLWLEILLRARSYFNRPLSDDEQRKSIVDVIDTEMAPMGWGLKEDSDVALSSWLKKNGRTIFDMATRTDLFVGRKVVINGQLVEVEDDEDEFPLTPGNETPDNSVLPSRKGKEPETQQGSSRRGRTSQSSTLIRQTEEDRLREDNEALKKRIAELESARGGGQGSSSSQRYTASTIFTEAESNAYPVKESEIIKALGSFVDVGPPDDELQRMLAEVDGEYVTNPPENGAMNYLASRQADAQNLDRTIRSTVRRLEAARIKKMQSSAQLRAARERIESMTDPNLDILKALKPVYKMGLETARAELELNNPADFSGVTLEGLLQATATVRTSFANLAALFVLQRQLQYPDRYRPALTEVYIREKILMIQCQIAAYGTRVGRRY